MNSPFFVTFMNSPFLSKYLYLYPLYIFIEHDSSPFGLMIQTFLLHTNDLSVSVLLERHMLFSSTYFQFSSYSLHRSTHILNHLYSYTHYSYTYSYTPSRYNLNSTQLIPAKNECERLTWFTMRDLMLLCDLVLIFMTCLLACDLFLLCCRI